MKISLISENLKMVHAGGRKAYLCIILDIKQNLNFPAQNWKSGVCFGSCKEKNTGSDDSKWLKSWLLRRTDVKKVNAEWQEKKIETEYNSFLHRATFKRIGNHKEGTQIFDLFCYYIDFFLLLWGWPTLTDF
jgi:hypothetical protein